MASPAGHGRRRRREAGLPFELRASRRRARNQIRGLPTLQVRWGPHTRACEESDRWRAAPPAERGRLVGVAGVRQALAGLHDAWSARTARLKAYCVEIASPEGFRWLAFVPDPRRQGTRAGARRRRDACQKRPSPSRLTRWNKAWIIVTEGMS
jgi:hypothetical protein